MSFVFFIHASRVRQDNFAITEKDIMSNDNEEFSGYVKECIAKDLKQKHPFSYAVFSFLSYLENNSFLKGFVKKIMCCADAIQWYFIKKHINRSLFKRYENSDRGYESALWALKEDIKKVALSLKMQDKTIDSFLQEKGEGGNDSRKQFIDYFKELSIIIMQYKKGIESSEDTDIKRYIKGVSSVIDLNLIAPAAIKKNNNVDNKIDIANDNKVPSCAEQLFKNSFNMQSDIAIGELWSAISNNVVVKKNEFEAKNEEIQQRRITLYDTYFSTNDPCIDGSLGAMYLNILAEDVANEVAQCNYDCLKTIYKDILSIAALYQYNGVIEAY